MTKAPATAGANNQRADGGAADSMVHGVRRDRGRYSRPLLVRAVMLRLGRLGLGVSGAVALPAVMRGRGRGGGGGGGGGLGRAGGGAGAAGAVGAGSATRRRRGRHSAPRRRQSRCRPASRRRP